MRKILVVASAAIMAAALSAPASAQSVRYGEPEYPAGVPLATGAAVGTLAGVGTYEAWWGTSAAAASLPTTAASSAILGGVAGVGTVALIDASIKPCSGFHALAGANRDACVNGEYAGYRPARRAMR